MKTATLNAAIKPFVHALGYNTADTFEVFPEYSILNSDAVDLAILRDGDPIMFVEAKRASQNLNSKHWKQLFQYFNATNVRYGILTNGLEFQFYTDLVKPNLMDDEPFLVIELLNLDAAKVAVLEGFTKGSWDPVASMRRWLVRGALAQEMHSPSDALIRVIAARMHSGAISKEAIAEYRPLVRQAWRDLGNLEVASRPLENKNKTEGVAKVLAPSQESKIESENEPPPSRGFAPIYGYYDGKRFEAELRLDSVRSGIFIASKAVRFQGELMPASHATYRAIASIKPDYSDADWKREKINSWTFWHVVDPLDGSERILRLVAGWKHNRDDELYERILSS